MMQLSSLIIAVFALAIGVITMLLLLLFWVGASSLSNSQVLHCHHGKKHIGVRRGSNY